MLQGPSGDLPLLASVAAGPGRHEVCVTWAEGARAGQRDTINLGPHIASYEALKPLRDDPGLFASVRMSEHADAIEWGPDDSLAVSGATLERLAEAKTR